MKGLYGCCFCVFLFFFYVTPGHSQSDGDYRSRQTGNWNSVSTWQVFNAGAWHNLEDVGAGAYQNTIPSNSSGVITLMDLTTVTVPNGQSITADQIEYENNFGGTTGVLSIAAGGTLVIDNGPGDDVRLLNDFTTFALLEVAGTLQLNTGATIVDDDYGNLGIGATPVTADTYKVYSGGVHIHTTGTGVDRIPAADWQSGSTCQINATSGTVPTIDPSITFHHFVWNGAGQTAILDLNGGLRNINGDLTVSSTNGQILRLTAAVAYTLNIGNDFSIQGNSRVQLCTTANPVAINAGGDFVISSSNMSTNTISFNATGVLTATVTGDFLKSDTSSVSLVAATTGTTTLNVLGNFSHTGGTITRNASVTSGFATINFNGASTKTFTNTAIISNAINFVIASQKTLNLGTSPISGSGSFTLNGTIGVGATDAEGAIQLYSATSTGNIRNSASRTYASGSTIVYNGAGAQFIGDGFPSSGGDVNLTIDNPSGVTLSNDLDIVALRTLFLASGNLSIADQTLTINGTVSGSGGISGGPTSNLVIGGSGNFGTLTFAGTNQLLNFSINRTSSGLVTLGGNLEILGTFTQTAGDIAIGANTLTIGGDFDRTGGDFLVDEGSSVVVNGVGTLPAEIGLSGTTLGTLTLNRASATFTTNATIDITNLNLTSGTLDNGTGIAISNGGTITRSASGSMVNSPSNTTTPYNVVYDAGSPVTTGPELTGSVTALNDLTKTGTSTVTLAKAITVNGDLTLSNGTFNASTFAVTLKGDLVSNATGNFESSALTFGGTSFIRGNTPPNFNNFTVATGSSLNLGTGKTIYVSGNITNDGSIFGGTSTIIFDGSTVLDGGGTTALKADLNNVQIAATGTFAIACAACTASNPYRIDVSGDFTVLTGGTFTENTSRVRLIGTGTQTLAMNGQNFNILDIAGAGTVTLADPLIVSDDLIIRSTGTLNTGGGNETITIGDELTLDGTFVPNLGTVVFNGSGGQSISRTEGTSTINFYNLNISKTASTSFTVATAINIQNSIDIDQPGGGYTVDFGGTVSSPLVTLLSDASTGRTGHILAIPDGVTLSGNVRINRFMEPAPSGNQIYRYISSPINGNPVSHLQDDFPVTGTFTGASTCASFRPGVRNMYYYNESATGTSDNGYVGFPVANVSEAMVSGRGYAVQMCDGQSIITWDVSGSVRRAFSGTPVSLPVTYTDNGLPNDDGLNLVGNPFPAPIDWESDGWTKTNVTNTFWIRNNKETNIASYNGDLNTGTNDATQYIALGQAFWVQATAASPVLSITEAVKQDLQPEFFRSAPLSDLLRLIVSREGASDEIIVHFDERADGASNTFGDSRKLMSEFMNLYSFTTDSVRLAINSLGALTCSSPVGIGLSDVQPGTYTFTFNGFDSFTDATIMLIDHWKGVTKELNAGTAYTFEVSEDVRSFGNARFQLLFTRGEGIQPVDAEVPQVCEGDAAVLTIHNPQPGVAYYAINAAGQVVSPTITAKFDAQLNIDLNLGTGSHELRVMATRSDCGVIPAASLSAVEILGRPSVEPNSDIFICGAGSATVSVTGGSDAVQYNWYESETGSSPLATTALGEWITPELDASRQYYVSASNRLGCEGPRVPISIELRTVPPPVISLAYGKLSTTGSEGSIEWHWQGELVQEGGNTLDIARAGEYSLFLNNNGCEAMATIKVNPEDLSEDARLRVSPNPAVDYVNIEIYSQAAVVNVSLIQSTGQVISSGALNKTGDQYFSGRIDLENTNAGLYILRIDEDNRITYKRLIRK